MNDQLDRAVHHALGDFFAAAPQPGPTPTLRVAAGGGSRPYSSRVVSVAATVAVATGIAGIVTVAQRDEAIAPGTSPESAPLSTPNDSTPASAEVPNPGYHLTALPDGLRLTQVLPPPTLFSDDAGSAVQPMVWYVLGKPSEDGSTSDKIDVYVRYGRVFAPVPGAGYTREAATLNGVPGEIVRSIDGDTVYVEYQWGEIAISILADAGDDEAMVDEMVQIANSLTVDEGGAELTGSLPTGYEVLAEEQRHPTDIAETSLYYTADTGGLGITLQIDENPPEDFKYWFMGRELMPIEVGGQPGFVTTIGNGIAGDGTPRVMWLAEPDVLIIVDGYEGFSVEEVLAAAESLEPITDAEWEQIVADIEPAAGVATTTVVVNLTDPVDSGLVPTSTSSVQPPASDTP